MPTRGRGRPAYDVIDPQQRAALKAQSEHNVVEIDLPQGDDPYGHAAEVFAQWRADGVLDPRRRARVLDPVQDYTGPDGKPYTRSGFFGRVKVEEYGPGRVRPHERTHPGPKEDRLRLTRATKANLSPIFVPSTTRRWTDRDPRRRAVRRRHRPRRHAPPALPSPIRTASPPSTRRSSRRELLIADGHHRYETARVYAEEIGGEGAAPLRDGLPRLARGPRPDRLPDAPPAHRPRRTRPRQEALRETLKRDWNIVPIDIDDLEPTPDGETIALGYMDNHFQQAFRLTLKDEATVDDALPDASGPTARSTPRCSRR